MQTKPLLQIALARAAAVAGVCSALVMAMDGNATGADATTMVKKGVAYLKAGGKPFVKERIELAQAKVDFWQDCKFTNPTTEKIEPKRMYGERVDNAVLCGGIYE